MINEQVMTNLMNILIITKLMQALQMNVQSTGSPLRNGRQRPCSLILD